MKGFRWNNPWNDDDDDDDVVVVVVVDVVDDDLLQQKHQPLRNKNVSHLCQVIDGDVEERVDNPDSTVYLIFMEAHKNEKKFNETMEPRKKFPGGGVGFGAAFLD